MLERSELESALLAACEMALRQLYAAGEDNPSRRGAAWEALTKAIAMAEASAHEPRTGPRPRQRESARLGAGPAAHPVPFLLPRLRSA